MCLGGVDKYGVDVFTDNNLKVVSHEYVVAKGDNK